GGKMEIWLYTLLSVLIVSAASLVGIFTISLRMDLLKNILIYMVSLSAGALLGGAFLHLLPEAAENGFSLNISVSLLAGILLFFIMEKIIRWRHCHHITCDDHPHSLAAMNLFGDAFHNFIDGAFIAGSYLISIPLGISITLAVVFHEIPQEIGDFGVLVYAGFSRAKALVFNFLIALTAVLGALTVLLLNIEAEAISQILVPFTAGGFIYIATSDLIPELRKDISPIKSIFQLLFILIGIGIMWLLLFLE
ncbi:MAG: ZIP family metal transporter, partial [bacterium]